jgi:hypothetical protein
MVRGSAIRVTGLGKRGEVPEPFWFATSRSVATIQINEVTESSSSESLGSETDDDDIRLRFNRPEQTVRYKADLNFLRCDPGVLSLVAGVPLVTNEFAGFGVGGFGEIPFGGDEVVPIIVKGFDSVTRQPAASFALEVWTRLAGTNCVDGVLQYGYTVFPFLRGGYLSGFEFKDGLVSFNLKGAQTRKVPRWGVGPYDLEGPWERLTEVVSRNTMYRQMLTTAVPPVEACGLQQGSDILEGGNAALTV